MILAGSIGPNPNPKKPITAATTAKNKKRKVQSMVRGLWFINY